jgi:hypothetical protein
VSGELTIVASADIDPFGPKEGSPVGYAFHWYYHVQAVLPWLILMAMFLGFRQNWSWQALWMLAPMVILLLAYVLVKKIMGISSGDAVELNGMFAALVGGFTALWLPARRFERLGYPTTILSIVTLIVALGLALFLLILFKTHFWQRRFEAVFQMTLR